MGLSNMFQLCIKSISNWFVVQHRKPALLDWVLPLICTTQLYQENWSGKWFSTLCLTLFIFIFLLVKTIC